MSTSWSARTAAAICRALLDGTCGAPADRIESHQGEVVRFVLDQQARMPDYARLPLALATLAFDLFGFAHHGHRFVRADPPAQRRQVDAWRASRLPFAPDLIRFYESMVVYRWYSDLA